jgi:hypothetical protein
VAYIDLQAAIIFTLQLSKIPPGFQTELILTLQKELLASIEAKLQHAEVGKKAKDKTPPPADGKIDPNSVTDSMCQGLPIELRKRCVGLYYALDEVCKRRGCVWDVWGKGYIDQFADLAEVCNAFDDQEGRLVASTAAAAEQETEGKGEEQAVEIAAEPQSHRVPVQLIVELQV